MVKKNQTQQVLELLESRPNDFLSCVQISAAFPEMNTKSVSAVLSSLFKQRAIKRDGTAYGVGERGWFCGNDPTPTKRCLNCRNHKKLTNFQKCETNKDGRTDICAQCIHNQSRPPRFDLLSELLAVMPATVKERPCKK